MAESGAKYRARLPQLSDRVFLTDGGMETTLIFLDGIDLPFIRLVRSAQDAEGTARAPRATSPATPRWRATPAWASCWKARPGAPTPTGPRSSDIRKAALADLNRKAIDLMVEVRDEFETPRSPMVISGNIGPRGDGYNPGSMMSAPQAQDYHAEQIAVFRDSAADLVSAFTINYVEEAIGIARAANAAGLPVGDLVHGRDRRPAADRPDAEGRDQQIDAETGAAPAYYMINCAHPTHFAGVLDGRANLDQAAARPARQRFEAQPRRARPGDRSRRRRSGRARPPVRRAAPPVPPHHRAGRLLRHRSPPRRADPARLRGSAA